ncbi:MAG: hypothetical protein R3B52_02280 [Candidatus Paceibacterota bacterium]
MRALSKKILSYVAVLSIFAIIAVGLTFGLSFDINRRAKQIEAGRAEQVATESKIATLSSLEIDSAEAALLRPLLSDSLPLRDDLVSFRREMQQLSVKHGLVGYGFAFGNETIPTDGTPGFIGYNLSIRGLPEQVLGFIYDFENHPYFITMPSINYVEQDNGEFQFTTSGKIFTRL